MRRGKVARARSVWAGLEGRLDDLMCFPSIRVEARDTQSGTNPGRIRYRGGIEIAVSRFS